MDGAPLGVVLSGGRSSRFGRDKLREPWGNGLLIDVPIRALREAIGGAVALAGECHPDVAARADLVILDAIPGCGPIGGIVAALEHEMGRTGVFVLAGDLACIAAGDVRSIWEAAQRAPDAWCVVADSGRPEPCVGLYRPAALPVLRERLMRGRRSLHDAFPPDRVVRVPIAPKRLWNANEASDLETLKESPGKTGQ